MSELDEELATRAGRISFVLMDSDGVLTDGRNITYELFQEMLPEELTKIKERVGEDVYNGGKFDLATEFRQ